MTFDTQFFDELARGVANFYEQKPFRNADAADAAIDEYEALRDRAAKRGLSRPKEGGDRVVVHADGEDYIVKVSKSDGSVQNREAIQVWQQMEWEQADGTPGGRQYVAPLVTWADDARWIVQKRARSTAGGAAQVMENLHEAGWTCSDVDGENVGVYEGRHVLRDLGVGLRRL